MPFPGESAALLAAVCWSFTSLLFSYAVRRLGSFTLNLVRITLAAIALCLLAFVFDGSGWLRSTPPRDLAILALSGWIGLTLGDWAYFKSMHLIGPRLSTLMMAMAPPMTVALGLPFLGERPGVPALLGMALTIGGIAWVVLERAQSKTPRGHRLQGITFGALGSLGQAVGLILSKQGMSGDISALSASSVRMAAATVAVWGLALATRRGRNFSPLHDHRTLQLATLGASILGPVTGIWLSLVAVRHTQAGIAATLMATVPVLILPLVIFVQKERVSPRAALGAVVAVAGVAVIFLRP